MSNSLLREEQKIVFPAPTAEASRLLSLLDKRNATVNYSHSR
jgi:hypothetical protein